MPRPACAPRARPPKRTARTRQQVGACATAAALCAPCAAVAQGGMPGALGAYPMSREASGTSWQPDDAPLMTGLHAMGAEWMVMVHAEAMGAYTEQSGPRGGEAAYQASMLMAHAARDVGDAGRFSVRGMASLEPLEGPRGYPLLFQTGETADGRTPLIDRQHPHNLLMEAALTYSERLSSAASLFVYAGPAGEPALGPSAFMHRYASQWNAEAPLTHHWLDSTHISYGVVTAGAVAGPAKVEASAFNGREPDQHRYDVELRRLDSYAVRVTLNPSPAWSLQASHGRLASPEQLTPAVSVRRTTASATWHVARESFDTQTLLAWGRNVADGQPASDGYLLDQAWTWAAARTLYARLERVSKDDLLAPGTPGAGVPQPVRKATLGASLHLATYGHAAFSAGAQFSVLRAPAALDPAYGRHPTGSVFYVRVTLAP